MPPIFRLVPGPRLAEATVFNRVAYLAGQIPTDPSADIVGQTAQTLAEVDAVLARLGTDKSRLLDVTIFLADMADYNGMNQAWDAWVDTAHPPARATVAAQLAYPDWKIEIKAIAALRE